MINAKELQSYIDTFDHDGVAWYGVYGGRGGFMGMGVSYDDDSALVALMVHLSKCDKYESLVGTFHHMDSLGMGMVGAWYLSYFDPNTIE